jgi:hypothetical protein
MPALAKTQKTHDQLVTTAVIGGKRPFAEGMAYRVDAPGDMMRQELAHQTAPEQTGQRAGPPAE